MMEDDRTQASFLRRRATHCMRWAGMSTSSCSVQFGSVRGERGHALVFANSAVRELFVFGSVRVFAIQAPEPSLASSKVPSSFLGRLPAALELDAAWLVGVVTSSG